MSKLAGMVPMLLLLTISTAKSVEIVTSTNSYYNTSNTISGTVANWSSGWGSGNTNTGWNYVGQLTVATNGDGAGGVYLGDGWVITAGHVGAGNFTLNGNVYDATGVSYSDFTNHSTGASNADLTLFQISTVSTTGNDLALPSLTIASNPPAAFSLFQPGSQVVMIGYGASGESWGINTVTAASLKVPVDSFYTVDFETAHGTVSEGSASITNNAELVGGDSGGGDFITNNSGIWILAGLNEAVDTNGDSYFVQLGSYDTQIKADMSAIPEPSSRHLLGLGAVAMLAVSVWRIRSGKFPNQSS